ncbi:MAG: type 1 glutamine amidotransferase, partial [Candidatus Micrarchaeia archaeon]
MRVLIVKNAECEGPGLLGKWLEKKGFACSIVSAFREKLPATGFDFLVLLGGPMSVYEEDKHPFLRDEIRLIQRSLEKRIPILGICLGGQL